ncbi:MAG: RnfABCDGE type electron transport complex subunit B [Prevotella sp.]|nr:RnfABCDGE type electron transport complex subunit B [Prevotella sp.]MCM1074104.1 RnfABCDGE type electron transport complex subunit B [Ruminococcus sp.]
MDIFWLTVMLMGGIGIIAAAVLYYVSRRFYVHEDERIATIEECLPGANCGACGYKGCHDFACACCSATSLEGISCPGAGAAGMKKIASFLGLTASNAVMKRAVVACNGSCSLRPDVRRYDGVHRCSIEASVCEGESDCAYGCLGCGDCVEACPYDALHIDHQTELPVVDIIKCVGCGKCVDTCPRGVMEMADIPADHNDTIYVACRNRDKGAQALKECQVSCIGCGKCKKVCPSGAVSLTGPLAFIDTTACTRCGACLEACPRKTILKVNTPQVI